MANGGIPDIGVRLTASGVQDVVNAFRKVREEGAAAGKGAAGSFGLLNTQLESLKGLIPLVTFGLFVQKIVEQGLAARETAENIGKLSEKTGAAVGPLSALTLAAHDSEVSQEAFGNALVKLARNMQDAATGAAKPKKAFTDLGISLKDLQTQDPGKVFGEVAAKLAAMPDGAHKAQISIALFSKTGAELLPLLKSLGTDGIDAVTEKAKRLGLYLDTETVRDARAAQDAFHDLEDEAAGLATRFNAGFLPGATKGIEAVAAAFEGEGVNGMKAFGEFAGKVFEAFIGGLLVIEKTSVRIFQGLQENARYYGGTIKGTIRGLVTGDFSEAVGAVEEAKKGKLAHMEAIGRLDKAYEDDLAKASAALTAKPAASRAGGTIPGGGADGDGTTEEEKKKAREERDKQDQAVSAYIQSKADNRLAILKASNSIAEAEDKRHYEAGLLTVDAYYDKVEERASKELADEIAALDAKRAGAEKLPDDTVEKAAKKATEIEKIDAQISETAIHYIGIQAAAEDERTKAKHDNAIKELEDEKKLATAAGDARTADQIGLALELQQYSELLQKRKDLTEEQKKAALNDFTVRGKAKIDFGTNSKAAAGLNEDLNGGIGAIQDQSASGAISEVAAQAQILALEKERLPALIAIGQVLAQNALESKDPDLIRQAEAYNASIKHIQVSLQNVTTAQTYLFNTLSGQGRQDFEDFFTAIGDGSKSAGDAFNDLADSFEQQIARMVSKLLVFYALEEIVGFIAPVAGKDFLNTLSAAGPFGKFATGGWTGGSAGRTAGIVHGEEFVVKAGPAAQYRTLLEAINSGGSSIPAVRSIASTSSVASDYAASIAGDAAAAPVVQVINTTGQPTQQKQTMGAGGKSITQIIVGAVQQDIAQGGLIAKQVESQYALARGGTRRG